MDKYGIDKQVITLAFPASDPVSPDVKPEISLKIAKNGNDKIKQIVDSYPDRFIGIGEVAILSGKKA